jgi:Tfp pilus assembly protein PilX
MHWWLIIFQSLLFSCAEALLGDAEERVVAILASGDDVSEAHFQ